MRNDLPLVVTGPQGLPRRRLSPQEALALGIQAKADQVRETLRDHLLDVLALAVDPPQTPAEVTEEELSLMVAALVMVAGELMAARELDHHA